MLTAILGEELSKELGIIASIITIFSFLGFLLKAFSSPRNVVFMTKKEQMEYKIAEFILFLFVSVLTYISWSVLIVMNSIIEDIPVLEIAILVSIVSVAISERKTFLNNRTNCNSILRFILIAVLYSVLFYFVNLITKKVISCIPFSGDKLSLGDVLSWIIELYLNGVLFWTLYIAFLSTIVLFCINQRFDRHITFYYFYFPEDREKKNKQYIHYRLSGDIMMCSEDNKIDDKTLCYFISATDIPMIYNDFENDGNDPGDRPDIDNSIIQQRCSNAKKKTPLCWRCLNKK